MKQNSKKKLSAIVCLLSIFSVGCTHNNLYYEETKRQESPFITTSNGVIFDVSDQDGYLELSKSERKAVKDIVRMLDVFSMGRNEIRQSLKYHFEPETIDTAMKFIEPLVGWKKQAFKIAQRYIYNNNTEKQVRVKLHLDGFTNDEIETVVSDIYEFKGDINEQP